MAKLQSPSRMKPGAGGGPIKNAKAEPKQRTNYLKAGIKGSLKGSAKPDGDADDKPRRRK